MPRIHITAPKGLVPNLHEELTALGFPVLLTLPSGIETEGSFVDCMRLNLYLRTAHHVLMMLSKGGCANADELYSCVNDISWESVLSVEEYLSVVSHVENPTIRDSRFANLVCKDAIVDRMQSKRGRRPDSGPLCRGAVVNLFWRDNDYTLYLDTSGESLSKRGYRKIPLEAPMQESLAAGVVSSSRWRPGVPFVNPMCGSGTLAIEAALLAANKAPGLTRTNFGFMHVQEFDSGIWNTLVNEARARITKPGCRIIASDLRVEALEAVKRNGETAGVDQFIEIEKCDFPETTVPAQKGVAILNPEYGIRMGDPDALKITYRRIGEFFKKKCTGYWGYIFTANEQLASQVGLSHRKKIPFFSGKIKCWLYEYELYQGSKRDTKPLKAE